MPARHSAIASSISTGMDGSMTRFTPKVALVSLCLFEDMKFFAQVINHLRTARHETADFAIKLQLVTDPISMTDLFAVPYSIMLHLL